MASTELLSARAALALISETARFWCEPENCIGGGTLIRCKDADVRDALQRIDAYAKSGLRASGGKRAE